MCWVLFQFVFYSFIQYVIKYFKVKLEFYFTKYNFSLLLEQLEKIRTKINIIKKTKLFFNLTIHMHGNFNLAL
jgi:hypothetical protein